VISLEVAEHLVASSADDFVCSLVAAGKVVLFGAAIPIQDGQNHINEQWSYYWIEKFKSHGYNCYDIIRSKIWGYDEVDFPYKSNTFIFVHNSIEMQGCSSDDTPPIYLHPYMCNKIDKIILGKRGVSFYIKLLVKSIINKFSGGGILLINSALETTVLRVEMFNCSSGSSLVTDLKFGQKEIVIITTFDKFVEEQGLERVDFIKRQILIIRLCILATSCLRR
jgi:hypothetical protein